MIRPFMQPGLQALLASISKHRILSQEEERDLIRRTQEGDELACRHLCAHNLKFVLKVAIKFQGAGLPLEDLIAEGTMGLHAAARRFDLSCQYKFISYAVWWIRQAMLRAVDTQARLVRILPNQEQAIKKLRSLPLTQFIGGEYLHDERVFDNPAHPAYLQTALDATTPVSMDTPINPEGDTYASFLTTVAPSPDDWTATQETARNLARLLHHLDPKGRRVINLLFGLETGERMTLDQVADLLGVTGERVRQIKEQSLKILRKKAAKWQDGASPRPEPAGEGTP